MIFSLSLGRLIGQSGVNNVCRVDWKIILFSRKLFVSRPLQSWSVHLSSTHERLHRAKSCLSNLTRSNWWSQFTNEINAFQWPQRESRAELLNDRPRIIIMCIAENGIIFLLFLNRDKCKYKLGQKLTEQK